MRKPPDAVRAERNAAIKAGATYFAIVFAIGFCLGALRVLFVAPHLGETAAVSLEAPIMLAFSWVTARRCIERFKVGTWIAPRLLMGSVAFALLMAAELGMAVLVFGRSFADHLAGYRTLPGAIGLVAQIAFAFVPALQAWLKARR